MPPYSWLLLAQQLLNSGAADAIAEIAIRGILPAIGVALLWYARSLPGALRRIAELEEGQRELEHRISAIEKDLIGEIRSTNHNLANVRMIVAVVEERCNSIEARLKVLKG